MNFAQREDGVGVGFADRLVAQLHRRLVGIALVDAVEIVEPQRLHRARREDSALGSARLERLEEPWRLAARTPIFVQAVTDRSAIAIVMRAQRDMRGTIPARLPLSMFSRDSESSEGSATN